MVLLWRPPLLAAAFAAVVIALPSAGQAADHKDGPTIKMPGQVNGLVIHIDDGDTLVVLDSDGYERVIRLSDIDAPEAGHGARRPGQPYSAQATQQLKALALGKQARSSCYDIDARARADGTVRERYVCQVSVAGLDVNMAMLDAGLAMAYRKNSRFVRNSDTYNHEAVARQSKIGLWAERHPVPPWGWRNACWERAQCSTVAK